MTTSPSSNDTLSPSSLSFLDTPGGRRLAYRTQDGGSSSPGLVYIHDMAGNSAEPPSETLARHCAQRDVSFLSFDLSGHGHSTGDFENCTITTWLEDIEAILNSLTSGPLILVGNALGAWLMFLYTMRNPERVFGLVGMATAADFTHLLWKSLNKSVKDEVKRAGFYTLQDFPSEGKSLNLSLNLILDGEKHTILDMAGLELIQSPTLLLHGDQDSFVPHSISLQLMQKLKCPVELQVIENGSHHLYRTEDLKHMLQAIDSLLDTSETTGLEQYDDDD